MNGSANDRPSQILEKLLDRQQLHEKYYMDHECWREKQERLAERLHAPILILFFILFVISVEYCRGFDEIIIGLTICALLGFLMWERHIFNGFRSDATSRDEEQIELLALGLELARTAGYPVRITNEPDDLFISTLICQGRIFLSTSIRIDGTEEPFMKIYLGARKPYKGSPFFSTSCEPQLSISVDIDRGTLKTVEESL